MTAKPIFTVLLSPQVAKRVQEAAVSRFIAALIRTTKIDVIGE